MDVDDGGIVTMVRSEVNTGAPFKSVKEAVMMFGEKVLAGEIYANKLKEIRAVTNKGKHVESNIGALSAELEETKQNLEKARAEINFYEHSIKSLKEELEHAIKEIQELKAREFQEQTVDPENEELKFEETPRIPEIIMQEQSNELLKTRHMRFASASSLAQVIASKDAMMKTQNSNKKTKKKPLVPVHGWVLPRKEEQF